VSLVQGRLGSSQRRTCSVLGQHRSTQRYVIRIAADESALVGRIEEIARAHPRYGERMVCGRLRRDDWRVNHKRVHRLCRREGLRVPRKQRRKRHLGVSANGIDRRRATRPNDVWCWAFVEDSDHRVRPLRWLTLVDEFTRECHPSQVHEAVAVRCRASRCVIYWRRRSGPVACRGICSGSGAATSARTSSR
jgi:putative transposase